MNKSRFIGMIGFCGCVLVMFVGHGAAGPASAPTRMVQTAVEPIAQLAAGKTPGTMHLVYHARAEFSMPGHWRWLSRFLNDITTISLRRDSKTQGNSRPRRSSARFLHDGG